eukprot:SM000015S01165  [mRNA]  locus=s15:124012:125720:+ [translate_table: standard]
MCRERPLDTSRFVLSLKTPARQSSSSSIKEKKQGKAATTKCGHCAAVHGRSRRDGHSLAYIKNSRAVTVLWSPNAPAHIACGSQVQNMLPRSQGIAKRGQRWLSTSFLDDNRIDEARFDDREAVISEHAWREAHGLEGESAMHRPRGLHEAPHVADRVPVVEARHKTRAVGQPHLDARHGLRSVDDDACSSSSTQDRDLLALGGLVARGALGGGSSHGGPVVCSRCCYCGRLLGSRLPERPTGAAEGDVLWLLRGLRHTLVPNASATTAPMIAHWSGRWTQQNGQDRAALC